MDGSARETGFKGDSWEGGSSAKYSEKGMAKLRGRGGREGKGREEGSQLRGHFKRETERGGAKKKGRGGGQ